jgi:hypothetical protein
MIAWLVVTVAGTPHTMTSFRFDKLIQENAQ